MGGGVLAEPVPRRRVPAPPAEDVVGVRAAAVSEAGGVGHDGGGAGRRGDVHVLWIAPNKWKAEKNGFLVFSKVFFTYTRRKNAANKTLC